MGKKISEVDLVDPIDGSEEFPVDNGGAPGRVAIEQVKDFVIDEIEGITEKESVEEGDGVFILDSADGALKPVDVNLLIARVLSYVWAKATIDDVDITSDDLMLINDGGASEKKVTLGSLAEAIRGLIEGDILDVSHLDTGTAPQATDYMLITRGTTAKQITYSSFSDAMLEGLADYLDGLTGAPSVDGNTTFYGLNGTSEYKVTLDQIATYVFNDTPVLGSGTVGLLAEWVDTDEIGDGPGIVDAKVTVKSSADVPTTNALLLTLEEIIYSEDGLSEDIDDADLFLIHHNYGGVTGWLQNHATFSNLWNWFIAKFAALTEKTALHDADDILLVDSNAADVAKRITIANFFANLRLGSDVDGDMYYRSGDELVRLGKGSAYQFLKMNGAATAPEWASMAGDIEIESLDEIDGPLEDSDLILVKEDGGDNCSSLMSRLITYVVDNLYGGLGVIPATADDDIIALGDTSEGNMSSIALSDFFDYIYDFPNYERIWIPANQMVPGAGSVATTKTKSDKVYPVIVMDDSSGDDAFFDILMPSSWDYGGSNQLNFKIYWMSEAVGDVGKDVRFKVQAMRRGNDAPLDLAYSTSISVTDEMTTEDCLLITAATGTLTATGAASGSDMIAIRIAEYSSGLGDPVGNEICLLGVSIQYRRGQSQMAAW